MYLKQQNMSTKSKKLNQQELLNIQNNADDENTNRELSSKHYNLLLEGTPFRVYGNDTDGFIIVLGKHRICPPFEVDYDKGGILDAAWSVLENEKWNIIFNVIASMLEINEEMRKNTLVETENSH